MDNEIELMVGDKKAFYNPYSEEEYDNINRIANIIYYSISNNIDITMVDDTILLNINKINNTIKIVPLNKTIRYHNYELLQHAEENIDGLYKKLKEAFRVIKQNYKITYIDINGDKIPILVKKTRWMRILFISILVIFVILGIAFAIIRK